jgi:hypothetical protein
MVAERKNTLSLVFCAAALLAYLKFDQGGPRRWYPLALGFFIFALLSKTSVVMLPVVLLGCAWWQRGKICARDWLRAAPFFALSLLLGVVTVWFQHQHSLSGQALGAPLTSRIAAAGCAVWSDHENVYFNIGCAWLLLNQPDKAIGPLREAVRLSSRFVIRPPVACSVTGGLFFIRRRMNSANRKPARARGGPARRRDIHAAGQQSSWT